MFIKYGLLVKVPEHLQHTLFQEAISERNIKTVFTVLKLLQVREAVIYEQ